MLSNTKCSMLRQNSNPYVTRAIHFPHEDYNTHRQTSKNRNVTEWGTPTTPPAVRVIIAWVSLLVCKIEAAPSAASRATWRVVKGIVFVWPQLLSLAPIEPPTGRGRHGGRWSTLSPVFTCGHTFAPILIQGWGFEGWWFMSPSNYVGNSKVPTLSIYLYQCIQV